MKHGFCLTVCMLWVAPAFADEAVRKSAVQYVQKLQTDTGGFLISTPAPNVRMVPTLRATSAAVRTLKYLGGEIPHLEACKKFVREKFDVGSGGFVDGPGGEPDVFTTAVGMMAVAELRLPVGEFSAANVKFLSERVKSFEEIRIAAAGLERYGAKSPRSGDWLTEIERMKNAKNTFGKDSGNARDTASAYVTWLRLGATMRPAETPAALEVLRTGQRSDGGFGKLDSPNTSDLETSYRVLRAFVMLKARPANSDALRGFVMKCRNDDGGFGLAPGQPSTVNGTYFYAIITHWLDHDLK